MSKSTQSTDLVKPSRKPTRSANSIILDGIAAYRAETEAGEGRGHLGVYAAERIYDSLTSGQRSAVTRKLNAIGFDDGSGNRPNSRFISFAGQCVYGIELPEETPSEGFPATPPMRFSELVAERQAIASEIVAAVLEAIPSKDEEIDSIARRHAKGIAYAARLRREDKDGWRAESGDRLFWFSLGQQARDDYNRFLDLMGIVHEWSEDDGDYEPDSWRYARFVGMCVTGSPIFLPSHFPIPPDEDFELADDDAPLDFAPSWAEYCQGAMVTWPATPVPSFLGDGSCSTSRIRSGESTLPASSSDAETASSRDKKWSSRSNLTTVETVTPSTGSNGSTIGVSPVIANLNDGNSHPSEPDLPTLSDWSSDPSADQTLIIEGLPYSYAIEPEGIILTRPDDVRHAITIGADGPSCSCPSFAWQPGYCKHGMALIAGGLLPADTPSQDFPEPTPEDWEDIYRDRDAIDDDHDTPSGVWDRPDDFPEDHTTMTPEEARELLVAHGLAPISGGAPEEERHLWREMPDYLSAPGPWWWENHPHTGKTIALSARGGDVLLSTGDHESAWAVCSPANMRLIESAPDLLEAARMALATMEHNGTPHWQARNILMAAIAKATGRVLQLTFPGPVARPANPA